MLFYSNIFKESLFLNLSVTKTLFYKLIQEKNVSPWSVINLVIFFNITFADIAVLALCHLF